MHLPTYVPYFLIMILYVLVRALYLGGANYGLLYSTLPFKSRSFYVKTKIGVANNRTELLTS